MNSQKKLFLKLGNFTTHYSPSKRIYKIYILRIFWSCQNFKMKLPNFKVCFIFSNFCVCSLTYISKLAREWKLAEICLFEFDYQEFPIFVHENVLNYYTCVIYIVFEMKVMKQTLTDNIFASKSECCKYLLCCKITMYYTKQMSLSQTNNFKPCSYFFAFFFFFFSELKSRFKVNLHSWFGQLFFAIKLFFKHCRWL